MKTTSLTLVRSAGLILIALGLSGCTTTSPRCQVAISNVTDAPISNIVLTLGDAMPHTTPTLAPHTEAYCEPTRALPSKEGTMTWKNRDGKTLTRKVAVEGKLARPFRGRVYFQINKDDTVQAFVSEDTSPKQPVMPWGKPERWEGTVGIPGLSGEEDL